MADTDDSYAPNEEADKAASPKPVSKDFRAAVSSQVDDLMAAVKRLEGFAATEAKRVSTRLEPVGAKARENIWTTVLMALGLGVILGLLMGGTRRRD